MVMLASLRANPLHGADSSEKGKARDLYDQVSKILGLPDATMHAQNGTQPHPTGRSARKIAEDVDMHIEIARLWQEDNLERMHRALKEALRISETTSRSEPKLVNNVAVMAYLDENLESARTMFESALTQSSKEDSTGADAMSSTLLYNLARTYEQQGDETMAKGAYEKLLDRHPEYVDGECLKVCSTCHRIDVGPKCSEGPTGADARRPEQTRHRSRAAEAGPRFRADQPQPPRVLHLFPDPIQPPQAR